MVNDFNNAIGRFVDRRLARHFQIVADAKISVGNDAISEILGSVLTFDSLGFLSM